MNGGQLDYLYWDPEMEPRVGLGTDADEDEEGSPERGVEAEVVPGSSTEVGNFLGEEEYEVQPETDDQPETESDADRDDSDHIRDNSGAREVPDVCICHTDCLEAHEIPNVCSKPVCTDCRKE